MFSECANPDCHILFDYREGRFFRFHKEYPCGETPPNTHSVQHFWLCGKCSELYTLGNEEGRGIVMRHRPEISIHRGALRFVAAA
jgi:hypothetical protein